MEFKAGSSKYAKEPQRAGITIDDPVSSCDEFPRPLGPMLKYIAKTKLQSTRRKAALKGVKTNQARKSEKRNKLHLSKAPTQGKRRPAAKVTKKRALTTTKPRKPKATGIIDVNGSRGNEKSGESNDWTAVEVLVWPEA
ncbi:uncharacterized protein LOC26526929 [Drosophila erecta]|uniref:Uncharacterized protein n=1 Tax=Drosophila erecta TaxID=7220 RepID=A0A0Q5WL09_DROER|nr:uncharacterized protein LOC26526929 [Drosophila erecta]KQS70111.1 uncharacterized protein Dere_GG27105 [Drosophila erecta]